VSAIIMDGKAIAKCVQQSLVAEVEQLKKRGIKPGLAVILVGDDPASHVYVRNKEKACHELGIDSSIYHLPQQTSQDTLLELIQQLNCNEAVHGILVQKPLPAHVDDKQIIAAISVAKDVDGFHPVSVGNLFIGDDGFVPCTPAGVMEMLKTYQIPVAGKRVVVIGRSNIVGKPMMGLLIREHATVTICHSRTERLAEVTQEADIVIAAIGQAEMIKPHHIKHGAVVIDVGMNRLANGKLVGDVEFDSVKELASAITPVPGGVGRMTIAMLMKNTIQAAQASCDR
jgi:methylenetetrahydrofolate dehydrogenase (NADP+)/methenyltetrahydrofolate cyclohydrolase